MSVPASTRPARSARSLAAALAAALSVAAVPPLPAAPSGVQESPREILEKIKERKDRSPDEWFEALGERRDAAGLKALEAALGELRSERALARAARAFRHFAGVAQQEARALATLQELALEKKASEARAGAKGLAEFGSAAHPALEVVIARASDETAKALALAPLVDRITAAPDADGLALILAAWRSPQTTTAAIGVEILQNFRTVPFLEQMAKAVSDESLYRPRRELVLAAVAAMPLEGEAQVEADEVVDRGLAAKDPAVQFRALEAVVKRGRALRTAPIEALTRSEALELRRLAHVAAARLRLGEGGDTPEATIELARAKDPAARQAAALELARIGSDAAMATLRSLLADPDVRVRSEAVRAMSARRRPSSVEALIERLDAETGKVRLEVHWALRMLTGEDHGGRAARWKNWWAGEGDTFTLPSYAEALEAERSRAAREPEGTTKASFYGIEVVSDRLAFVIDVSRSMREQAYGGEARIDVAKTELSRVIEKLHADDVFNLISFSDGVTTWERQSVPVDAKSRESALRWVERLRADGATAVFDALKRAFEDERIDTIYFLSDGEPSAGAIVEPGEIRREIARWNSARHVTIHCIAVGQDHALLRGLAEDSGGTYRRIK